MAVNCVVMKTEFFTIVNSTVYYNVMLQSGNSKLLAPTATGLKLLLRLSRLHPGKLRRAV